MERIKNFFKDESGASAVEYGLLVALIAVVIIGAVTALGTNLNATFQRGCDDTIGQLAKLMRPGGRVPPPPGPHFSKRRTELLNVFY